MCILYDKCTKHSQSPLEYMNEFCDLVRCFSMYIHTHNNTHTHSAYTHTILQTYIFIHTTTQRIHTYNTITRTNTIPQWRPIRAPIHPLGIVHTRSSLTPRARDGREPPGLIQGGISHTRTALHPTLLQRPHVLLRGGRSRSRPTTTTLEQHGIMEV